MSWHIPAVVSALSIAWIILAASRASLMGMGSGLGFLFAIIFLGALNLGVWGSWLLCLVLGI